MRSRETTRDGRQMMEAYCDNNATTRVVPEVVEAMTPYYLQLYHNASSISGQFVGLRRAIGDARLAVAQLLGTADADCVIFTSGATESNNWVISGVAHASRKGGHIVASPIEHPSVLEPLRRLESMGWRVDWLPVDSSGVVDPGRAESLIRPDTALVSVMAANNETGVIQPISELAAAAKRVAPGLLFHTDATQMVGKCRIALDEAWHDVDLVSLSAHKFHGPKGCGALFIRRGCTLPPLMLGGGQQDGLRSGTLNVPAVVGMGEAAKLVGECGTLAKTIGSLRDAFEAGLRAQYPDVVIHGEGAPRLPNTSCFSLSGCHAESVADRLASQGVFVGTGAACSSGSLRPSNTLLAMGVQYELADAAIRVSLSRYTTGEEVEMLLKKMAQAIDASA